MWENVAQWKTLITIKFKPKHQPPSGFAHTEFKYFVCSPECNIMRHKGDRNSWLRFGPLKVSLNHEKFTATNTTG